MVYPIYLSVTLDTHIAEITVTVFQMLALSRIASELKWLWIDRKGKERKSWLFSRPFGVCCLFSFFPFLSSMDPGRSYSVSLSTQSSFYIKPYLTSNFAQSFFRLALYTTPIFSSISKRRWALLPILLMETPSLNYPISRLPRGCKLSPEYLSEMQSIFLLPWHINYLLTISVLHSFSRLSRAG